MRAFGLTRPVFPLSRQRVTFGSNYHRDLCSLCSFRAQPLANSINKCGFFKSAECDVDDAFLEQPKLTVSRFLPPRP